MKLTILGMIMVSATLFLNTESVQAQGRWGVGAGVDLFRGGGWRWLSANAGSAQAAFFEFRIPNDFRIRLNLLRSLHQDTVVQFEAGTSGSNATMAYWQYQMVAEVQPPAYHLASFVEGFLGGRVSWTAHRLGGWPGIGIRAGTRVNLPLAVSLEMGLTGDAVWARRSWGFGQIYTRRSFFANVILFP